MERINSHSSWDAKFNAVVAYKNEFGKFPTYKKRNEADADKYIDILAKWIQYQKEQEVKGKLSEEMKLKCEKINGWKWTENSKVRERTIASGSEIVEKKQEIVEIPHSYTFDEISAMKLVELKALCIRNNYKGYSKFGKGELIDFIMTKRAENVEEEENVYDETFDQVRNVLNEIVEKVSENVVDFSQTV